MEYFCQKQFFLKNNCNHIYWLGGFKKCCFFHQRLTNITYKYRLFFFINNIYIYIYSSHWNRVGDI